jgi:hypothetical protein
MASPRRGRSIDSQILNTNYTKRCLTDSTAHGRRRLELLQPRGRAAGGAAGRQRQRQREAAAAPRLPDPRALQALHGGHLGETA